MKRMTLALAASAVLLALAGCTSGGEEMSMTPEEALEAQQALVTDTQEALGGSWRVQDSPVPDPCPDGGEPRSHFLLSRFGDPITEAGALVEVEDRLRQVWGEAGLDIEKTERTPTTVEFVGTGRGEGTVTVIVGSPQTLVSAYTACFADSTWDPDRSYLDPAAGPAETGP